MHVFGAECEADRGASWYVTAGGCFWFLLCLTSCAVYGTRKLFV